MALSNWSTTTANNSSVGTNPWAEGMSPAAVNDAARERMADVRSFYEGMEWRDWGHTPTYSAATAFTISSASSLSSIYAINRRIKTIDSVTTSYGTIVDTTWVSSTQTVHVDNSVSLSNPMTSVAVGLDIANQPINVAGVKGAMTATGSTISIGDLLYGSATATLSSLAVGASTAVLMGGTTPSWTAHPTLAGVSIGNVTSVTTAGAAYAQYGFYEGTNKVSRGLTWLETQSPNATATVTFTAVLAPAKRYRLEGRITVSASDSAAVRFNGDSGANYGVVVNTTDSVAPGNTPASSSGSTQILINTAYAAGDLINFDVEFETQQGDNTGVIVTFNSSTIRSTRAAFNRSAGSGFYKGASALSSLTFFNYNAAGTHTGILRLFVYEE